MNARPGQWRGAAGVACIMGVAIAGAAAQQTPLFRADVNIVVVEASVVDRAGGIARGLQPADFRVEISGKARDVLSAELIEYDATGTGAIPTDPDITTNLYSNSARTILIVVDQQSLRVDERTSLNAMKRWVTSLGPGDRVGLVTLPAPGPRVEFTTNRQAVIDGLSRILPRGGSTPVPFSSRHVSLFEALRIDENDTIIRDQVIARECQTIVQRDPGCPDEVDTQAHSVALESQTHVRQVIGELVGLSQALGRLPGPKHVVYVSSGLPTDPREAMSEMSKVAGDAALGNVTMHTFTIEPSSITAQRGRPVVRTNADEALLVTGVEMLAGLTGGRSARLAGQGDGAFKALSDGLTGYYRLGVRAELEDLDGKSHRIGLDVTKPGLVVTAYRRMLAGVPQKPEKPLEARAALRAALESATPKTEVNLRATTYVLHGQPGGGEMRVVAVGDIGRAAAGPATAVAALYTLQGLSLTAMENAIDVPVTGSAPLSIALNAPPGTYILRLAVRDVDGRMGSLERPIEVGWRKIDGVETPGLTLFRSDDRSDSGPKPLFRAVSSAERIIAQVPVSRPAGSAAPEVVFEVTPQGGSAPVVRTTAKLATTTSGATVAREVVQAALLPPGAYTMTATIGSGGGQRLARSFVVEPAAPGETPVAAPAAAAATAVPEPAASASPAGAPAPSPSVRVVAGGPAPYPFTKAKFSTGAVLNPGALTPVLARLAERPDVLPVREPLQQLGSGPWSTDPAHGALAGAPVAAQFVAGLGRLQQGDLASAADAFRAVLRTAPDFTPALAYLGACDAAAGRDAEAANAWEQAIAREPAASSALYRLAIQARLRADQSAPALALVRQARQRWPDDETFVGLHAQAVVADGRPREAVELIDGMTATDPATLLVGLEVLHEASTRKTPLWDSFRDLQTMRRLRQRYAAAKGSSLALVDGWIGEMAGASR